ncbi:MAG: hypothetical protein ABR499_22060 [Gemmatimonadaceae bacterium]
MVGRALEAVLRKFDESKEVRDGERVLELWRDADSGEVRLRDRAVKHVVAVDEHQLELTIMGLGQPVNAATVASLLCRIYDQPEQYFGTRVLPVRSRATRRRME